MTIPPHAEPSRRTHVVVSSRLGERQLGHLEAGELVDHGSTRPLAWATLLQRVFEVDVLACPRCGGRMRVLATLEEPAVVQKILTHVGLPTEPVTPRAPPPLPGPLWEPA